MTTKQKKKPFNAEQVLTSLRENPDLAYLWFKEVQSVLNISAIEKTYQIPSGSLDSAKKSESQTSYKHSDKLVNLFLHMLATMQGQVDAQSD